MTPLAGHLDASNVTSLDSHNIWQSTGSDRNIDTQSLGKGIERTFLHIFHPF